MLKAHSIPDSNMRQILEFASAHSSPQLEFKLNYQIEHHLFPSVHFKHYPALSKIVQATCKEFDLPYHHSPSFLSALKKHFDTLRIMGTQDLPTMKDLKQMQFTNSKKRKLEYEFCNVSL